MNGRRTVATAARVLRQLRHDARTVALLLLVPVVLLTLLRYIYDARQQVFQTAGPPLLALFPFVTMFVVTSVAMLRERSTGTLERLMSLPVRKLEVLLGYALAFGAVALLQVALAVPLSVGPLGLALRGDVWLVAALAVADALLGMALGLLLSAFARTEFQAVQFLPAFVFPQLLLCGLFVPRDAMPAVLHGASDVLPLSYAVDGVRRAALGSGVGGALATDIAVVLGTLVAALVVGALTLRRRTA